MVGIPPKCEVGMVDPSALPAFRAISKLPHRDVRGDPELRSRHAAGASVIGPWRRHEEEGSMDGTNCRIF